MGRTVSPVPQSFASEKERDYWHMAQDIAYRAGAAIVERDGASWLITSGNEKLLYRPTEDGGLWWQSWLRLQEQYPGLSRLWVGGRAITKPGQV
ncbi:MAG: putative integron cassette protein [Phycisphaerales bacterium]|nr:putative integron cassette protein [Phycisphaerales bacterium]